ncbi:MAG: DNA-binding protein, partial [Prevotellaceae bacterium]|nr:DNA-binding protein [Prevotellaceae bacterium]
YGTTNYSKYPVKEGDVVNIVGPHSEYKGSPQMVNGTIDEVCASAEPISLADFNAAEDSNDKFYVLTGKITEIANDKYGNLYIEDEAGTKVYLYGVYGDWTGQNKQYFIKDNGIAVGDTITVVTIKTSHNDAPQGKNAVCFGVKKAN